MDVHLTQDLERQERVKHEHYASTEETPLTDQCRDDCGEDYAGSASADYFPINYHPEGTPDNGKLWCCDEVGFVQAIQRDFM